MSDELGRILAMLENIETRLQRLESLEDPSLSSLTGIVPVANGGTGANLSATGGASQVVRQNSVGGAFTVSQLGISETTGTLGLSRGGTNANLSATGGAGQVLQQSSAGAAISVGTLAISSTTGTLAVSRGGTGATTLTSNGVLLGNGTSAVSATAAGTADQVLRIPGAGGAPAFGAIDLSKTAAVSGVLARANLPSAIAYEDEANVFTADQEIRKTDPLSIFNATTGVADFRWQRASVNRWFLRMNSTAESGSDAGSDWQLISRTDAGALKSAVITALRSNGFVGILDDTPSVALDVNGSIRAVGGLNIGNIISAPNGVLAMVEQTAPAAPATNAVYIYPEDNGAGKTRLMARFATGAAVQIAIEP